MSGHATAEVLSAYLDEQLRDIEAQDLERHLESCSECSTRLDGLRRVVSHLRRAEQQAPPSTLQQMVARRIALEPERRSALDAIEDSLSVVGRQSPILGLFAVVTALGVMLLMLSIAIDKRNKANSSLPVIFQDLPPISEGQLVEVANRTLAWRSGRWVEQQISDSALQSTQLVEISLSSAEGRLLVADHPELSELVGRLSSSAVLEIAGQLVELTE